MEREMGGRFKTEGIYVYLWVNLTQMTIISTTVGKNPLEEME